MSDSLARPSPARTSRVPPTVRPDSLAVVGLGAIGGSVAWQARLAGVPRVVGFSPVPAEGVAALKAAAVSELADSPERAARGATLVILATPPNVTLQLIEHLAPLLEPRVLLSDVTSVKLPVMARAVAVGLGDRFAGAHPLAGTHGSGFAHARPDRMRGSIVYVCPSGTAEGDAAARGVMGFWEEVMEASPVLIDAAAHDRQLAWTSHLPQAVAYALAKVMSDRGLGSVSFGPGARDTLRLAASNPELWIDIFLQNEGPVLEALEHAGDGIAELRQLIAARDSAGLRRFLEAASAFRRGIER
jgi:prephenate dehydrogenase